MSTTPAETAELGRFSDVDASGEAAELVAFLERVEQLHPIPELRERSYQDLKVRPGRRVVDVGCGAGVAVAELAAHGAEVTGVDPSENMVAMAKSRFPDLDYQVAGAASLPFAANSLDGYRAERVYQHLSDPQQALDEAKRVLKPGARLAIVDLDGDGWIIDAADKEITRALLRAFADTIANPWIGRQLRGLLLDNGFTDVTVDAAPCIYTEYADAASVVESITRAGVASKAVTQEQADTWLAEQQERSRTGRFFVQGPLFLAAGTHQ
ncbi:methyltransferase domain-containing protein [Streptomyces sp. H27-D2]|uniref:methyltransferase domain-containing protein n=1 Tax=Streptomyces sp. H27-D2 TaxID=3046304 RepID=UPI002DBC13AC|nr:methyltransferase domain-containing protein [Streptomyces sp. H27-D2]MEC4015462.1 methyltransferase domain-containing protein [Streptomyces sp. H27-D2]